MTTLRLVIIKPLDGIYGFTFDQDASVRATQVTSVVPSGVAARAGLEPGQVIVSIGDTPLHGLSVHEVQSLIDESTSRFGEVALYVSDRAELSRPSQIVSAGTASSTVVSSTEIQPRFQSQSKVLDQGLMIPVPDPNPTPLDTTGSDVNVRLVRKEAYRPVPSADATSTQSASRPLFPESERADLHPTAVDLLLSGSAVMSTPRVNFKSRHTNVRSTARLIGSPGLYSSTQPQLGAVASLAIDGGLSPDQLLHIGSDPSCRSPVIAIPPVTSEDTEVTVTSGRALMASYPRNTRPTYATHQPIVLSRTGQGGVGCGSAFRGLSRAHIRIPMCSGFRGYYFHPSVQHHPFYLCTSTAVTTGTRRGSFPLQMTRVGGLVLDSRDATQAQVTQPHIDIGCSGTYQSLSACTSPTSAKHTSDSSSSPRGTTFFSSSSVPSPSNTPPLPPAIAAPVTAPTSCVDIVRLGPGGTVTHALSNESQCNTHSLIRTHYYPQPYVGLGPMDDTRITVPVGNTPPSLKLNTASGFVSTTASQVTGGPINQFFPLPSFAPDQALSSDKTPNEYSSASFTAVDEESAMMSNLQLTSPNTSHTRSPTSQTESLHTMGCRSSGFVSPTGPQVARTVRHLRRIRHIFGDSLGYVTSANSASMGALVSAEKNCASVNSLVELRPHGSRSVESVRPASLVCKCSEPDCVLEDELAIDRCPNALVLLSSTDAQNQLQQLLVRFEQLPVQYQNCKCPTVWEWYRALFTDDTLRLTRLVPHGQTDECDSPPAHIHLKLNEASLTWHSPSDLSDLDMPSGTRWATGDSVIGFLRVPGDRVQCQLYFLHRQFAIDLLGQWGPMPPTTVATTGLSSQTIDESTANQSLLHECVLRQSTRGKQATGRSSSLGLAGPPGGVPLLRAMGTAAASVGMPLVGRSSLPSWLHPTNQKSSAKRPGDSVNGEVTKEVGGVVSTAGSTAKGTKKAPSAQTRPSRGRFHQAFTRMRRAATASSAPTARSPSRNTGARRFASSHGALMSSKSSVSTTSCTGSPPSVLDPQSEGTVVAGGIEVGSGVYLQATNDPVARSSPALLAASVSPLPALQSPYVTYSLNDGTTSADERVCVDVNNLDIPISKFHSSESFDPIAQTGSDDNVKAPQSKVPSSSESITTVPVTSSNPTSTMTGTEVTTPAAAVPSLPHPFIPLPAPPTGPLALHKCPRSTLSPFVPFIVELCVTLVERYGLNCVGLYRLSGSKVAHDFISTELRKNLNEIDVTSDKWNDIHAVCGVLKTFLRNLPDSLFPKVMYADFLSACRVPQREKRLLSIQRLLSIMECYPDHPEYRAHRATLRYLATHLARVSAREAVNKMTAYNLALVFAPNLVQPCEDSPELLMSDSKYKIMLVETVIKYHAWIFSPDLGLESGCSVPTDSTEELSSTVSACPTSMASPEPMELSSKTATEPATLIPNNADSEDPTNQPGRLEGDVQPLVAELLNAAADLPPPPSDTDLETAEEPGPSSDRPSDISVDSRVHLQQRPRFTSIPTPAWSAAALNALSDGSKFRPELVLTQETDPGDPDTAMHLASSLSVAPCSTDVGLSAGSAGTVSAGVVSRPRPFTVQLGNKLDSLRHLSQGCLDQYTTEARQLGVRVAESRRQLQTTVAQRLHAEQLLMEARGQQGDSSDYTDQQLVSKSIIPMSSAPVDSFTLSESVRTSPGRQPSPKDEDSSSGVAKEYGS